MYSTQAVHVTVYGATMQWWIQDGAFGANAPSLPPLSERDRI